MTCPMKSTLETGVDIVAPDRARISVIIFRGWNLGPWGNKTLCVAHYVKWRQKETLNLSKYVRAYMRIEKTANYTNST